jgi:hypothetical protein
MSVETSQVRLGLIDPTKEVFNQETGDTVTGKQVLQQLSTNNVWRNSPKGKYVAVQYNAQTFKFFVGESMILPESVGRALRKSSAILVGEDKLNGPIIPFLEIQEKMEMTIAHANEDNKLQKENEALKAELEALRKQAAEPAKTKSSPKGKKIDWDGDVDDAEEAA